MDKKYEKLNQELDDLINKGKNIYFLIYLSECETKEKTKELMKKTGISDINEEYNYWYSLTQNLVKEILPNRYEDFVLQYKNPKRKEITRSTYTMSDYLISTSITQYNDIIASPRNAIGKFKIQLDIVKSIKAKFESNLFDISEVLQADIFDTEIDAAIELNRKGFVRAAGAIGGVVLEKHLGKICSLHELKKSRKKHPTISDFYQLLKDEGIIDISQWRFIQHLGDIRNKCDHVKDTEPTKEEIDDFLKGVDKVLKTVY